MKVGFKKNQKTGMNWDSGSVKCCFFLCEKSHVNAMLQLLGEPGGVPAGRRKLPRPLHRRAPRLWAEREPQWGRREWVNIGMGPAFFYHLYSYKLDYIYNTYTYIYYI